MVTSLIMTTRCPRCLNATYWLSQDGLLKCTSWRETFSASKNRIHISRATLRKVIEEFLLEHSTNNILTRVNISTYMLLKVLAIMRTAMTHDVPEIFEGNVEVDETYLGGQWKNKTLSVKR